MSRFNNEQDADAADAAAEERQVRYEQDQLDWELDHPGDECPF